MAKGQTDLGRYKQSMSGMSVKGRNSNGFSAAKQPRYSASMKAQGACNRKSGPKGDKPASVKHL